MGQNHQQISSNPESGTDDRAIARERLVTPYDLKMLAAMSFVVVFAAIVVAGWGVWQFYFWLMMQGR